MEGEVERTVLELTVGIATKIETCADGLGETRRTGMPRPMKEIRMQVRLIQSKRTSLAAI